MNLKLNYLLYILINYLILINEKNNKKYLAIPDVTISKLTDLEFIVLACDGIFDVMNNTEVIKFVRSRLAQRIHPKEVIFNPL